VGPDVHLGARIGAVGHGGQVLMSGATRQQIEAETTDLGEHRLKDLDELVWIYQLGSERFPPLKTISNSNLPIPASTFVGRSSEVDEIAALIRGEARLITLSGPGGTGKTRLAIEAASTVIPEFRNGVFWAGLAPLRDPGLVLEEVSQTLGVKDGLAEFISEREMLLVLDNLEQVIDAAPDLVALLERCPNLKMLVTSRELLRVRGEVEYPVLPLAEPDGVELFSARSGLVADGSIVKLCRSLDHLPLALELAAARTGVLTAEQILERLDKRLDLLKGGRDADQRQATLRALIDWSYELLSDEEKRLFERLSVFRGGCSLEAAEEVADADLDTLQALVDKSLVRHTADRFWMLETIREYAVEHLRASADEIRVRDRYVDYFMNLASEAFPHLRDIALRGPGPLLDRLEDDLDNFRSVLDHLESTGRREAALRLAGDIAEFWYQRGYLREGHQRLEALLKDAEPSPVRAKALIGASDFAAAVGDAELGLEHAREAVELFRSIGDDRALADAFWRVASLTGTVGGWAEAVRLLEQTIAMFTELDDQHALLAVTRNLAWARENLGDLEGCRILHEENLVRTRVLG
ncbi:MAG: ATP-binding protein, partial [Actinomycetota bacterium]